MHAFCRVIHFCIYIGGLCSEGSLLPGSHTEPNTDDLPRRVRGKCFINQDPGREKQLPAVSSNNLPFWLLPDKSFKKQAGMLSNHMTDLETQQALMVDGVR